MSRKIGYNLAAARKLSGKTLDEIAELVGLSKAAVGFYEHDRTFPNSKVLLVYSKATGFSVDALLSAPDLWKVLLTVVEEQRDQANTEARLLKLLLERQTGEKQPWKPLPRKKKKVISKEDKTLSGL